MTLRDLLVGFSQSEINEVQRRLSMLRDAGVSCIEGDGFKVAFSPPLAVVPMQAAKDPEAKPSDDEIPPPRQTLKAMSFEGL